MQRVREGDYRVPTNAEGQLIVDRLQDAPFTAGQANKCSAFWELCIATARQPASITDKLIPTVRNGLELDRFLRPAHEVDHSAVRGVVGPSRPGDSSPVRSLLPNIHQDNHPLPEAIPGLGDPEVFLAGEIRAMVLAGAVQRVDYVPWVTLPLGVVVNGAGSKYRMVCDARSVNAFLMLLPFRFGRLAGFVRWAMAGAGERMCSVDAKAAYYAFSVAAQWREALGFFHDGVYYVYASLPFGLSIAPWIYQMVMEALGGSLRVWLGPALHAILLYLDDSGIFADVEAMPAVMWVVTACLTWGGVTLSVLKSVLEGVRTLPLLGLTLSLDHRAFSIPEAKIARLLAELASLEGATRAPVKSLQRVCGMLISLSQALPVALLLCRPLFQLVAEAQASGYSWVDLSRHRGAAALKLLSSFGAWTGMHKWKGDSHVHLLCVASDASDYAMGLVFSDPARGEALEYQAPILQQHLDEDIMVAEGRVLPDFLRAHGALLEGQRVRFLLDNECARISNSGRGSRHLPLNEVSLDTLGLLMELRVEPSFDRVTTADNSRPDSLSRLRRPAGSPEEPTAHWRSLDALDVAFGAQYGLGPPAGFVTPDIRTPGCVVRALEDWAGSRFTLDFMASPGDARVDRWVGRYRFEGSRGQVAVDCLSCVPGPEEYLFVNPPWRLVAPVWRHLQASAAAGVFLCPEDPTQIWFSGVVAASPPEAVAVIASRGERFAEVPTGGRAPRLTAGLLAIRFDFRRGLGPRPAPTIHVEELGRRRAVVGAAHRTRPRRVTWDASVPGSAETSGHASSGSAM
jgi:hypothetical protein